MLKFLLNHETKTFNKAANIAAAFILVVILNIGVLMFYKYLFAVEPFTMKFTVFNQFFPAFKHPFLIDFFFACIMAPIIEEVLFRMTPISILKASGKKELIIPGILFTSIIFGLMHDGAISILLQGVFGLVASMLYIKNNYSYWSSVILHFAWNTALTLGILKLLN